MPVSNHEGRLAADVEADPLRDRCEPAVNRGAIRSSSSAASLASSPARIALPPTQPGRPLGPAGIGLDQGEVRALVAAVERQRGEHPSDQVGGADAVAV